MLNPHHSAGRDPATLLLGGMLGFLGALDSPDGRLVATVTVPEGCLARYDVIQSTTGVDHGPPNIVPPSRGAPRTSRQ
jgi:hypothetical protein